MRFKELRKIYSEYDENDDIIGKKSNGPLHKPLVDKIHTLSVKLRWVLPVVQNRKIIYSDEKVHLVGNASMSYENINITSNKIVFNPQTGN